MPIFPSTVQIIAEQKEATFNTSGVATVEFGPPPTGLHWLIEKIAVQTTNVAETICLAYVADVRAINLVDGTRTGNLDLADEDPPIYIPDGQKFFLQWSNGVVDKKGYARIQYRLIEFVEGFIEWNPEKGI